MQYTYGNKHPRGGGMQSMLMVITTPEVEEYRRRTAMEFRSNDRKIWLEDENGNETAVLDYPAAGPGVVNFAHTEVSPSLGGQGVASKITQAAADRLREKGLKAVLSCSYSIKWFSKHPEYADVLENPEEEAQKARALAGPACGVKR